MEFDFFKNRHIGIDANDEKTMLEKIGVKSVDELIDRVIPQNIRLSEPLDLPKPMTEFEYSAHIHEVISQNKIYKSYIGMGWYDTATPAAILRNVFENPVWYTSYTPYQAEISQGRLEALINFQTVVCELTAMPLANCSLLDEATAAAEAATMMFGLRSRDQIKQNTHKLFVDNGLFPQSKAVLETRLIPQGIEIVTGDYQTFEPSSEFFGTIVQYPNATGSINDYRAFVKKMQDNGIKCAIAADILSLVLLTPPGEWGADIVFGSTQRLGIPMYYGGPSAAYFATKEEYKRNIPGRIVGISKDAYGKPAYRLALQTREQHIKREKATSNICTAQALMASMAGFYAVYHGAEGLRTIANRIHRIAGYLSRRLTAIGYKQQNKFFFDTLFFEISDESVARIKEETLQNRINLNFFYPGYVGISINETTTIDDVNILLSILFNVANQPFQAIDDIPEEDSIPDEWKRRSDFLQQNVFNAYRTETELMRYIKKLERKDISLTHSMISLGSCTMKLNGAAEMLPLSRPELCGIHPMAPADQTKGYQAILDNLSRYLAVITGFEGCSLQPNSGAAGEYAGLRCIRSFHEANGEGFRNTVLIPASAHGTNPASAVQAGYTVVVIKCDEDGNVDVNDLREKAVQYKDTLAACMITYPSTHGIFEPEIVEICNIIHQNGGQLYMDGANMNAQVGLTNPGFIGADICHLNLHKTFSMPHGGGGPGVGAICSAKHLVPFLPHHPFNGETINTVAAAPYGSAGLMAITYGYIRLMGADGLKAATQAAILNANYLAACLNDTYGIVYRGKSGYVGHELILECRKIKDETAITETDIAKRLMDFGFHAPTLSFPVHGTLMIEPTESESLIELNKFRDAMLTIYQEIEEVKNGEAAKDDNVLIHSPHPLYEVTGDNWPHSYSRKKAAYPLEWVEDNKFWPDTARIDNAYGDRNLIVTIG